MLELRKDTMSAALAVEAGPLAQEGQSPMRPQRTPQDRFFAKVEFTDTCWLWTASKTRDGYAQFNVRPHILRAHRWAYEFCVGPIPEGLTLDHVKARGCVNRHCVNPDHLEPVPLAENIRRGVHAGFANFHQGSAASKTHCKHGHEFTAENTYTAKGAHRQCKSCNRNRKRASYSRKENEQ